MKKLLLTMITVLILVFSSVLIYHISTDESVDFNHAEDGDDDTLTDISSEIDEIILEENDEIDIGEII